MFTGYCDGLQRAGGGEAQMRELLDPGGGAGQAVWQVLHLPAQVQRHLPGLPGPDHEVGWP